MARIVPSDLAPADTVHYTFAGVEFDLGGSGKGSSKFYETLDRAALSNASAHPWLDVQYDEAEAVPVVFANNQVKPEDDPLSAVGPNANAPFDPAEIAKVEEAKAQGATTPVAIDAGLDQTTEVSEGEVAETVAADDAADTKDKS
jgi:hypothetical protein